MTLLCLFADGFMALAHNRKNRRYQMPFANQTALTVRQSTYDELVTYKGENETWDEFLTRTAERALDGGEHQ